MHIVRCNAQGWLNKITATANVVIRIGYRHSYLAIAILHRIIINMHDQHVQEDPQLTQYYQHHHQHEKAQ